MKTSHWLATRAVALGVAALGCSAVMAQSQGVPNPAAPPSQSGAPENAAEPSAATPGVTEQTGPHSDYTRRMTQEFITRAAYANQSEIAAAHYALDHSNSERVKAFARQMIQDHTKADDQLKRIAAREGFTSPVGVSPEDRIAMRDLEQAHGRRFNAAYSESQERDHEQAVALFRRAAENPRIAPAVRDYARRTLPTLMDHLHLANQLVASEAAGDHSAG